VHPPPEQICEPEHAVPHTPQLLPELRRSVSHPFAVLPSQSPKPITQRLSHIPALHVAIAFVPAGHTVPHAPQFATSVVRSAHALPHGRRPAGHESVHPIVPQNGVAPEQTVPHVPQLFGSLRGVVQPVAVAGQRRKPALHAQVPALQVEFAPHAVVHAPQCEGSAVRSVSHPFAVLPSQSPRWPSHVHVPVTHD
jgi:hypothetical protein